MSTERPTHDDAAEGPDATGDGKAQDAAAHHAAPQDGGTQHSADGADSAAGGSTRAASGDVAQDGVPRGDGSAGRESADGAPPGGHPDDEQPGRSRRRSRLTVGSIAVAVLLAGGGGAYVAATAAGGHDSASDPGVARVGEGASPPKLALDGYPLGGAGTTGGSPSKGSGPAGIAPGEPDPNGVHGVLYRALAALPKGPAAAHVYQSGSTVTADQVTRLAKALGLTGSPRLSAGSWLVGGAGSGPALRVTQQAPGTWTFSRSAPVGDNCPRGKMCSGAVTGGQSGHAVSEQAAQAAAAPVLKALGQDDTKLDARQLMGAVRVVNADPEVGGLPTYGWSTGIRVGTDGTVIGGSGQVLTPVKGAAYPVLSADKTLALLNKSQRSRVLPDTCPDAVPQQKQNQSGQQGVCTQPRGTLPAKDSVMPVRAATFGLATHFVAGRPALVPSWFFEVRPQGAQDSFTLTYPAVDPAYLTSGDSGGKTPGAPTTPDDNTKVHLTSYAASGRTLTVHFYGGVCSTYTAAASESTDKVAVSVTEHREQGKICIDLAKEFTKTVTLKQPVDDRKVVDSTGATVRQK